MFNSVWYGRWRVGLFSNRASFKLSWLLRGGSQSATSTQSQVRQRRKQLSAYDMAFSLDSSS